MKKLILIITIFFTSTILVKSDENKDCSKIKKISPKYYLCKASNLKGMKLATDNLKDKKYLSDFFKKNDN